ncbi:MAG: serine hydrolase domain-containing protein [Candidatus Thorarchaeota archaeon]
MKSKSVCSLILVTILLFLPTIGYATDGCIILSQVSRDYWPTDEWQTSTPEEQGMNSTKLNHMVDIIEEREYELDGVLIVRGGYIVYEYYTGTWDRDDRHHIQSCTKCVTSTLVGIAIDLGLIQSVNSKMVDFFDGWTIQNMDDRKRNITIEHLLTWTDGMEFHEGDYPYDDPRNDLGQMWVAVDALQYCLDRPMWSNPGESFWMNSGTLIILGGIIEIVSGMSVLEFANEYLFEPLGIDNVYWQQIRGGDAGGWYHTDGGLFLSHGDFAKFGYLMLNNGTWDDQQIVSQEWVENATEVYIQTGWGAGYENFAYQWWIWPTYGTYAAHGHYEQALYVIPGEDMVVVFTGHVPDGSFYPADYLVSRFILPAVGVDITEPTQPILSQIPLELVIAFGGIGIGVVALVTLRYTRGKKAV